jgi:hypothetical protein
VKDVPATLEHIMGQALARDPRARYQSARDFGRDLNRVLFQLGRPVSSFDIGGLVGDVREEQRRQKGARPKQQTLIGSLIQDAMMSFTSLHEDTEAQDPSLNAAPEEQSGVGAIPLSFGTFEGSHAGARVPPAEPSRVSFAPPDAYRADAYRAGSYEAGNLAALEDHASDAPLSARHLSPNTGPAQRSGYAFDPTVLTPGHPQARPSQQQLSHRSQAPRQAAAASPAGLSVTYWVVTATLIAVGAAVGAYLAGVFS